MRDPGKGVAASSSRLAMVAAVILSAAMPTIWPAAAEQRVALVIGNDTYPNAPLRNPVNYARAMLAQMDAPIGTMIAFATAPGSLAYTQYVVRFRLIAWYAPEVRRLVKTVRSTFNMQGGVLDTDRYELVARSAR